MYSLRNPNSYYEPAEEKSLLNRILVIILILIVVIIVGGTAVGLSSKNPIAGQYRRTDPSPKKVVNISSRTESKVDAFTDLGQIRTVTKAEDGETGGILLIVSPWFSYQAGDTALFEELAQKNRQEKSIIMNYFGRYTEGELLAKGEKTVKEELCALINEQLVLGKIKNVYFDQYLFFE